MKTPIVPRPFKCRRVRYAPDVLTFKPAGIPGFQLEEVILTLDEYEAVRLADLQGLYQEEAAQKMNISRQTFGNIILSAHHKIADALINGKSLRIEGGYVNDLKERKFVCADCGHEWTEPFGTGRPEGCLKCKSDNIFRKDKGAGGIMKGRKRMRCGRKQ